MQKAEKFVTKSVEGEAFEEIEKKHRKEIESRDKEVKEVCDKLWAEGFIFEMSLPNENEIVLRAKGREFNFNKKVGIAERVEARIRELGK